MQHITLQIQQSINLSGTKSRSLFSTECYCFVVLSTCIYRPKCSVTLHTLLLNTLEVNLLPFNQSPNYVFVCISMHMWYNGYGYITVSLLAMDHLVWCIIGK